MMTREARAKQFMPFDAMKGLQEALRDREERHTRVQRRELSGDELEENRRTLARLEKGTGVRIACWLAFHDVERQGILTELNPDGRYLKVGEERIYFEDIYAIDILDYPHHET